MLQSFMMFGILPILSIGIVLTVWRLVRGPNFADRVVALDKLSMLAIGVIAAYAIVADQPVFMDMAIIVALLSFLTTVGFAHYVERRA